MECYVHCNNYLIFFRKITLASFLRAKIPHKYALYCFWVSLILLVFFMMHRHFKIGNVKIGNVLCHVISDTSLSMCEICVPAMCSYRIHVVSKHHRMLWNMKESCTPKHFK